MIVSMAEYELPLCPNIKSQLHILHINLLDTFAKTAEQNEDSEFVNPETDKIYTALSTGLFSGRMYLYREIVAPMSMIPERQSVQAFYFRCYICGFTTSAVAGNW